jgi:hypothetical protein
MGSFQGSKSWPSAHPPYNQLSPLKALNQAVHTITINSRRSSCEERRWVIEFFAERSGNPDMLKILLDALRRFGQNFSDGEKIRIAEILLRQDKMPPIARQTLKDALERIVVVEKSQAVGAALMALLEKVSD